MPKGLFYGGTVFCIFLALTSAGEVARQMQSGEVSFVALQAPLAVNARAGWAILVAMIGGLVAAALLLRMAALIAARNLFSAFAAVFSVSAAVAALTWLMFLQSRLVSILRETSARDPLAASLSELHLVSTLMLAWFVSLCFLALRPYFRVQASRFLSALVVLPLPLSLLIVAQEVFISPSRPPLPATSPALQMLFAVLAVLFFAIAVHCVRHRYLFIEMTNLRELLEGRFDPTERSPRTVRLGGAAFDS